MARLDSLLTLRQLRYFVSVVEHRNISSAAKALHIAQPSLSRQIGLLEEALKEQLLVRHVDGVSITDAGDRLYGLAQGVLDRVNAAKTEVLGKPRVPEGRVSVAIPSMAGSGLMIDVVQTCRNEIPLVDLQLIDGFSNLNAQLLTAGMVDFGLVYGADSVPGLQYENLLIERLYLVRANKLAARDRRKKITFEEICTIPLVVGPRETHLRNYLEHNASALGLSINFAYEQRSAGVIAAFVRAGIAASVSNWPSIQNELGPTGMTIQEIVQPALERPVALGYPMSRPLSHAARAAYDIVKRLVHERLRNGQWRGRSA